MQNEYQTIPYEVDECLTKGICSVNPTLTSIQEIILLYVKELSFYVLKLKDFDVKNDNIKTDLIEIFFNIVTNVNYNQDQFNNIISKLYNHINQSKALYEKLCVERNVEIETNKLYFKYSKHFELSDAIRKGEKYFLKKSQSFVPKQREYNEIMLFLAKSIVLKIIELNRLEQEFDDAYYVVLSVMNLLKPGEFSEENFQEEVTKTINCYYGIVKTVNQKQNELYGKQEVVNVSFSTVPGKAILVSGSDFRKLQYVLEAVNGMEISVYTHGMEMLLAHSFPKLRAYPNLKGHFGTGLESSLIDFATFPGPILMTQGTLQKVEYLYRGKLFTLDPIPPMGVIKIENDDYSPLIKSSIEAKGFIHGQQKQPMTVGYSETKLFDVVNKVIDKIDKGLIKNIYFIGMLNYLSPQNKYYEDFLNLLPKDCFTFSLSYKTNKENAFYLDSFYDYSLIFNILKKLEDKYTLENLNVSILLNKCDKHTISNLLYLKQIGIKHVYTCKCSPTLINPGLMQILQDSYGIKELTHPKENFEETLKI